MSGRLLGFKFIFVDVISKLDFLRNAYVDAISDILYVGCASLRATIVALLLLVF